MTPDSQIPADDLEHSVSIERARLLFRNSIVGVSASILLACVLVVVSYPYTGGVVAGVWFVALAATIVISLGVSRRARRARLTPNTLPALARQAIGVTALTGVAWGALFPFVYPLAPPSLQFLFGLIFAGMLAGAVAVYAGSFAAWLAYCAPVMAGGMAALWRGGNADAGWLLFFTAFFAVIVSIMAWRSERVLRATLRLGKWSQIPS